MNDKILLVNDLPGYGKVALSAMFPVMSHMGFDVYNLPTAVVSNTLDYGKFHILDTTDHMEKSISVWDEFDVMRKTAYGYVVIHNGEELFVRRSECVELI